MSTITEAKIVYALRVVRGNRYDENPNENKGKFLANGIWGMMELKDYYYEAWTYDTIKQAETARDMMSRNFGVSTEIVPMEVGLYFRLVNGDEN